MCYCSGYAGRIYELIVVSRELNSDDRAYLQKIGSGNYFSEADHVEFSGVKVLEIVDIFNLVLCCALCVLIVVLPPRLSPQLVMFWWKI